MEQPACGPIDLGAWIDDPPSLVLRAAYLDALRALPLSHVAVMVDGPRPGLADARWTERDLERLAEALPDHERVLTVWAPPQRPAVDELRQRLPELVSALGARAVETDDEPIGEWVERGVHGYHDEDGDGHVLDDASDALADVLAELGVDVEVTVFPGALRGVRPLLAALVGRVGIAHAVRLVLQVYAVRRRGSKAKPELVDYDGPLGPVRFPREAIAAARRSCPGVEVAQAVAAYDQRFPGRAAGDAMHAAIAGGAGIGVRRMRIWSSKHLVRLNARRYAAPALDTLRPIALSA